MDGFLDRMDAALQARVDTQVAQRLAESRHLGRSPIGFGSFWLALASIGAGIPISLAAAEHGILGLAIAWGGIAGVNLAYAVASAGASMADAVRSYRHRKPRRG